MSCNNYYRAKLILEDKKRLWLKVNKDLPEESGIYILTRTDEVGIKYAYIGQAKHILTRLAQHLTQYQHIDLSLKKHKLYNTVKNPYGWNVDFIECKEYELDEKEREYILEYANLGYQLRNKTAGGQNKGKTGIDDNKASKGYRDGLAQGRKNTIKEVKEFFDKYLDFVIKEPRLTKKGTPVAIKQTKFKEFEQMIKGE